MYQNPQANFAIIDHPVDDDPAKDPAINLQKYKLTVLKLEKQTA
jgi:hypothetical protein